jgi:hypothetical protein
MHRRLAKTALRTIVLAQAVGSFACTASPDANPALLEPGLEPPRTELVQTPQVRTVTYDDLLLSISRIVPGFGGLFPDSGGVTVWLLDPPGDSARVTDAIAAVNEEAKRSREANFVLHATKRLSFARAEYTFSQLHALKQQLYSAQIPEGTVYSGISKRHNRLGVGVESQSVKAAWETKLLVAGVPIDAVRFETLRHPPLATDYLQHKVRPTSGGVEIGWNTCSLGTNVLYRLDPVNKHFITASHCSTIQWGLDPVLFPWVQPTPPDTIGLVEAADPAPFSGGQCPSGKICRYTDVTVVRYTDPTAWQFAKVASANNPAPYPIQTVYSLVEQAFSLWDWPVIQKTGRTTGTTTNPDITGSDTFYCMDYHIAETNRTLLCQIWYPTTFVVEGGDSGGPVFGRFGINPPGTAYLVGLVLAGGTVEGVRTRTVVTNASYMAWDFGYDEDGEFVQYYTCIGIGFCWP